MAQDTNIENLIINKLTKAQYESIANPDPAQLYFITDEVISSTDVTNALGYTPYNSSNPNGYTSNVGTVTSVNNIQPDANGNVTLTIPDTATWGNITGTLSNQTDLQTALNGKADVDLSNVTDTGYIKMAGAGMPSNKYIDLTLGASGTTYTAPANGWVSFCVEGNANGLFGLNNRTITSSARISTFIPADGIGITYRTFMPIMKNSEFSIEFYNSVTPKWLIFIYAQGSESEAQ